MSCHNTPTSPDSLFPPQARPKTCGECGAPFLCGPQEDNGDCWCDRMPNIMPLLSPAEPCLCQTCLQQAIDRRLAEQQPASPARAADIPVGSHFPS